MVTGMLSLYVEAVMLVMLWLNGVNCQGINGRRGAEIRCFTEEDKIEILKAHNDYRRASNSSNMRKMEWNDDLEAMSQLFIDGCTFEHNADELTDKFGFRHIGENLYVSGDDFYQVKDAVDQWHSEIDNYDYNTSDCNGVCGHYTQTVWDDSYALGCGLIWCADLKGIPEIPKGVLIICNYGPGGNVPLEYPYELGKACSNCPAAASFCSDGLCAVTSNGSSSVSTANECPPPSSGNATTSGNVYPGPLDIACGEASVPVIVSNWTVVVTEYIPTVGELVLFQGDTNTTMTSCKISTNHSTESGILRIGGNLHGDDQDFRGRLTCLLFFDTKMDGTKLLMKIISENCLYLPIKEKYCSISKQSSFYILVGKNRKPEVDKSPIITVNLRKSLHCAKLCAETLYCRSFLVEKLSFEIVVCRIFDFVEKNYLTSANGHKYYTL